MPGIQVRVEASHKALEKGFIPQARRLEALEAQHEGNAILPRQAIAAQILPY
jgi:hypothetical protein